MKKKTEKHRLNFIALSFCVITLSVLTSCEKRESLEDTAIKLNAEGAIQLEVQKTSEESVSNDWKTTERKVCVIFGYEYNREDFKAKALASFSQKYGMAEDGGLILPLVYPDDFLHSGRARISSLKDLVANYYLDGMIILGAPESMNRALATIEDEYGGKKPYPVVAFFPQDDMLGIESTCDLVFERASEISDDEMLGIVEATIEYLPLCHGNLENRTEIEHATQMLYGKKGIKRYVDSDTGLSPENHFILE